MYLSKSGYLIHGTNKPASIGLNASNGCLRLYPENVKTVYDDTPVNTPVVIVNQPYLVGQRNGTVYLEAHAPLEGSGAGELEKIYGKLRNIEKKRGAPLTGEKSSKYRWRPGGFLFPSSRCGQDAEKRLWKP